MRMAIFVTLVWVYLGGLILTGSLVWLAPRPPQTKREWVFALGLWPVTLLALMALGTRR